MDSSTDTKKMLLSKAKFIIFFCFLALTVHPLWLKVSNLRPLLSITFHKWLKKILRVWTLDFRKWGQKDVKLVPHKNSSQKKTFLRVNVTPFMSESFFIWDHFFPLLFPKDFEKWGQKDVKTVPHKNGQTDRQTHTQKTFQLIERIGPEGRFFENFSDRNWPRGPILWKFEW